MAKIKLVVINEAAAAKITEGALAARSTTTYVDTYVSGEIWEGLNTRLVCRCCGVEKEVLITDDNLLNVPWECMIGGYDFYIGIYGCSGDGKVRVPTLWALVGKVGHSTGEAKITPNIPPSPSVVDQIIGITNDLNERVSDLEDHGGGVSGVSSINGMTGDVELEIPTKTSELENDSGFLTEHQDLSEYALKDDIPEVPDWAMEPNKPTYTAQEVGALPSDTVIPPAYDDSELRGQIEKKYTKPEDGIPATDLADGVAPTVSVEDDGNIHRVTITDSTGSHEFEIKDGISTKVQIDYLGDKIFKHGDKTLNFADLYDYHLTGPDFTFIVYGNRAYLCSFVDVDNAYKEMRFESVINSDLRTKVSSIYVTSTDGINISQVNVSDINSENSSNKIAEFTEANKNSAVQYPSNAAVNKELTELNDRITETQARISGISKVSDYLYNYTCPTLDYDYAADYFKSGDVDVSSFSCSSAKSGNFFGRNFDWLYDDNVEFVVKTAAQNNYHATIGVAGQLSKLTKKFVESGYYDDAYKILPFMITDGINDSGVVCNTNVVPMDYGETTGTISPDDNPAEICSLMLPRFVLDNFSSALEAVNYIRDHMSVYVPNKLHDMHYETHIMIADMHNAYAVEFINNQIEVIDITNRPYMTNFHLYDVTFNVDGSVYTPETMDDAHNAMITNGITQFGSGLERYNIIAANIGTSGSSTGMRELMDLLTYTNTYKRSTTPFWYTEFVGGQNTVISAPDDFESVVDEYIGYYNDRQRGDGKTWQTVHSAVYDIKNKTLTLREQEGDTDHIYSFNYYTKDEVDSQVSKINEDLSKLKNTTETPAPSGKVWTSTGDGAGWEDPQGGGGTVTDQHIIDTITNNGFYKKPAIGIPEDDLSQSVRQKLNSGGGGDDNWELIADTNCTDRSANIEWVEKDGLITRFRIIKDMDGNDFALKKCRILIHNLNDEGIFNGNMNPKFAFNTPNITSNQGWFWLDRNGNAKWYSLMLTSELDFQNNVVSIFSGSKQNKAWGIVSYYLNYATSTVVGLTQADKVSLDDGIRSVTFESDTTGIDARTVIKMWGVRK